MSHIQFYSKEILKQYTRWRWGEEKLGEVISCPSSWEELAEMEAKYVIVGIAEDVGVRANYGRAGTSKAWQAFLSSFCNLQHNEYLSNESFVLLGEIDVKDELLGAQLLDAEDPFFPTKIGSLVKDIDLKVSETISRIIKLNKIPILIGGGHNNSYGNLKGAADGFGQAINCINFDAHTDFRPLEHRHSGNGFSYAKEEGFLNNYYIFGLHSAYTSAAVYEAMETEKATVAFSTFESLNSPEQFEAALAEAKKWSCGSNFGLELDLDAIANMGSSAMSPAGFRLDEAQQFVSYFASHKNLCYFHLCEGAPIFELFDRQVGKAMSYLVAAFLFQNQP